MQYEYVSVRVITQKTRIEIFAFVKTSYAV